MEHRAIRPIHPIGSFVVASGNKRQQLKCVCQVLHIMPNSSFREYLMQRHGLSFEGADNAIAELSERRYRGYSEDPIYIVASMNQGRPSLSEVIQFIPDITDEQYEFLSSLSQFQISGLLQPQRHFTLPESALLPYDHDLMQQNRENE